MKWKIATCNFLWTHDTMYSVLIYWTSVPSLESLWRHQIFYFFRVCCCSIFQIICNHFEESIGIWFKHSILKKNYMSGFDKLVKVEGFFTHEGLEIVCNLLQWWSEKRIHLVAWTWPVLLKLHELKSQDLSEIFCIIWSLP